MINEVILSLIPLCAPDVSPNTIAQIIRVESGGNPLAINVNGVKTRFNAQSQSEAVRITKQYIAQGYSVDVGLMQVNSNNFKMLGYEQRIEDLFDPCNNIAAGAQILKQFYLKSSKQTSNPKDALAQAISAYNTGNFTRGFQNGYVSKVYKKNVKMSNAISLAEQARTAPSAVNIDALKYDKKL